MARQRVYRRSDRRAPPTPDHDRPPRSGLLRSSWSRQALRGAGPPTTGPPHGDRRRQDDQPHRIVDRPDPEGHLPHDETLRDGAEVAAVLRIGAIVTHHEICLLYTS